MSGVFFLFFILCSNRVINDCSDIAVNLVSFGMMKVRTQNETCN